MDKEELERLILEKLTRAWVRGAASLVNSVWLWNAVCASAHCEVSFEEVQSALNRLADNADRKPLALAA